MTEATKVKDDVALSTDMNVAKKENLSLTLHQKIATLGVFGWLFGLVMTGVLVWQSIGIASQDKEIMAVDRETGKVIGTVVFDEAEVRSQAAVKKDVKQWLQSYLSLNSETIFQDAEIALAHMEESLKTATYQDWVTVKKDSNSGLSRLAQIKESGNIARVKTTDIELTMSDAVDSIVYAVVSGEVISGIVDPKPAPFKYQVKFSMVPRKTDEHLGIEVYSVDKI